MEEREGDENGEYTVVERVVVASVHGRLTEMTVVQGREAGPGRWSAVEVLITACQAPCSISTPTTYQLQVPFSSFLT